MTQLRAFLNYTRTKVKRHYQDVAYLTNYQTAVELSYRRKKIVLVIGYGEQDDISVFRSGSDIFVLNQHRLPYIGLTYFPKALDYKTGDRLSPAMDNQVFLQESEQIENIAGKDWENKRPITLAKYLLDYIP